MWFSDSVADFFCDDLDLFHCFFSDFLLFNDFFIELIVLEYVSFFIIFREILFLNIMYIDLLNIYLIKNCNFFHEYSDCVVWSASLLSSLWISFSSVFVIYIYSIHIILTSSSVKTVVWCCYDCFSFTVVRSLALSAKMFRFFTIITFLCFFKCWCFFFSLKRFLCSECVLWSLQNWLLSINYV